MLKFKTKIKRGRGIPSKLGRFKDRMRDRQPMHEEIKIYQAQRWVQNFDSFGQEYEPWDHLARWSWRRDPKPPHTNFDRTTPLHFTGVLGAYVKSASYSEGQVSPQGVKWVFENQKPWAVSQQRGWNPKYYQPERIIWDIDSEDEDRAREKSEEWINSIIRRFFN